MESVIIVRYGEIFLKSEPVLNIYVKKLKENIKSALKKEKVKFEINKARGRLFIKTDHPKEACEVLRKVFGIVSFSPSVNLKTAEMKKIKSYCRKNFKRWIKPDQAFAVRVKREGKQKYTSIELAKAIGDVIDRKVDLDEPDVTVGIEVSDTDCHIFTEKVKGVGGLPYGSSGKMVALVSGGEDSPVAAWMMMKRGVHIIPIYMDGSPFGDKKSLQRVVETVKVLADWMPGKLQMRVAPSGKALEKFVKKCDRKLTCILCKRFMFRVAEAIAQKENAFGIVTGSSIAQKASQTVKNLYVCSQAVSTPLFHPLIGFDKEEIQELGKRIGTYEKSLLPGKGCTAAPNQPSTRARLEDVLLAEKDVKIDKLVKDSVKKVRVKKI